MLAPIICELLVKSYVKNGFNIFVQVYRKYFTSQNKFKKFFSNLILYPFKPASCNVREISATALEVTK